MIRFIICLLFLVCTFGTRVEADGQPDTRTFEVKVTFDGEQSWRNLPQWYEAKSQQEFVIRTELYSSGKHYAANLLEVDMLKRMDIKAEFQRQRGLSSLRAEGFDVTSGNLHARITERMNKEKQACGQDALCAAQVSIKYAGPLSASMAEDNSKLFEGEPRYAYYQPFEGCQSHVDGSISLSVKGETNRSKLRKKKKVFPFELEMRGVKTVPHEQIGRLICSYFLIVVDTRTQRMYVENVFFPEIRGREDRLEFEQRTFNDNASVPIASPIQGWVNSNLRDSAEFRGQLSADLELPLPLHGNATILGKFEGVGKTRMEWSFQ